MLVLRLNPEHPSGKDQARLFSSILGITADNAEELRQIILNAAKIYEVSLKRFSVGCHTKLYRRV